MEVSASLGRRSHQGIGTTALKSMLSDVLRKSGELKENLFHAEKTGYREVILSFLIFNFYGQCCGAGTFCAGAGLKVRL